MMTKKEKVEKSSTFTLFNMPFNRFKAFRADNMFNFTGILGGNIFRDSQA